MELIYIILPLAIVLAIAALIAFFWAVHRGQFDDLDTPRYRALFDDVPESPRKNGNGKPQTKDQNERIKRLGL